MHINILNSLTFTRTFYTVVSCYLINLKFMKKIISLALVVAVFFSGCGLFKKDPQKAVNKGISEFAEVQKMQSKMTLSGTMLAPPGEKPEKITFSLTSQGQSDMSDEAAPQVEMTMNLVMTLDAAQSISGKILLKIVGTKVYLNVQELNLSSQVNEEFKKQIATFLNKWWIIPTSEENPFTQITTEQRKLQEKFKDTRFFVNAREEGEEMVEGITATRYRVDLDKDALKSFLLEIAHSGGTQLTPDEEAAIAESLKDIEFSGAVWVGEDNVVHKISGTISVQPAQGPTSSFDVEYTGWNYDEEVAVTAPEGATEFSALQLLPIFGALNNLEGPPVAPVPAPAASQDLGSKQVEKK